MEEVQTNEEARVYVHDLNLFLTVQLLEDTLALSPGELCEEHGYSCEWASGQKPHPTEDGKNISMQDAQFRAKLQRMFDHLHRCRRIHQVHRIQQIHEVTREC